ncbi:regulator of chromosome condensation 1/beta-lactamase-inhibitor protein II [Endogone sp. FLAS-F59071]|nr:regulator of chromosome condensation 1/beta-lactamase-inhibitor protein II [Endogone sp. FLAS-F59071]|eukprot:RUS20169.1 regulator of chromosome condensation 1/beta-lactamase-inhibitor protein II [Endogone sp. FLAS-F59071]
MTHIPVALCWGSTNPFIKLGSRGLDQVSARYPEGGLKRSLAEFVYLFTRWQYVLPLALNLSDLSLAVPITNSLTFIFTMLAGVLVGEKINGDLDTLAGMAMVVAGVGLCVNSKVQEYSSPAYLPSLSLSLKICSPMTLLVTPSTSTASRATAPLPPSASDNPPLHGLQTPTPVTRHATPVSTPGTTLKHNSYLDSTPKTPKVSKLTATPVVRSPAARRRDPHITQTPDLPRESGRVFVFGNGEIGQLGLGDITVERKKPYPVPTLENEEVVDVVAGGLHTIAITKEGKLWSWGCNDQRALGRSGLETVPGLVENLDGIHIVKVACGGSITAALSREGKVYCWGTYRASDGQLGFSYNADVQDVPTLFQPLTKTTVVDIVSGADHLLALTSQGEVYGWGNGQQNQLGRRIIERRKANGLIPERLRLKSIVKLGTGGYHSFAVDAFGQLWAWGLNNYYQCGLTDDEGGTHDVITKPTIVGALKGKGRILQVTGGTHHSLVLMEDGEIYGFGRADWGQLGLDQATLNEMAEVGIDLVPVMPIASAASSQQTEFDLSDAGSSVAPLPATPSPKRAVREPTRLLSCPNGVVQIDVGSYHNLARTRDGAAYAWGFGETYALGNAEEKDEFVPVRIEGQKIQGGNVVAVAAGGQHSVLLVRFAGALSASS